MRRRLADLAALVGGEVRGDGELGIEGVATLADAGPLQLSFLTNARYREQARSSRAGALLVGPGVELGGRALLVAPDPYYALALILEELHPAPAVAPGIHPTAVVAASAIVDPAAVVAAGVVVGERSRIDAGVVVGAGCVIGSDCRIGAGSVLHPRVVLYDRTEVGSRCILHAGVVLGSDGFGFASHGGRHHKVPQIGRVVVEDEVEIGANSTVDRAALAETRIGAGTKIDNLVQVGHNVRTGRGCILVAQSGIAGSTELGDYVVVAGQSGLAGHLHLGDGVQVAAKSAVFHDVAAGQQVAGTPAITAGRWRRQQALLGRLEEIHRRLRALEARLGVGKEGEEE